MSRYRDVDVSAAPSIDATVTAAEDSGTTDVATLPCRQRRRCTIIHEHHHHILAT
jgi:hypothetical protein